MNIPMHVVVLWLTAGPLLIATLLGYDRIVRTLHDKYATLWDQLGKPVGYFWSPSGFFGAVTATHPLFWQITFRSPDWVRARSDLKTLVAYYRLCYAAFAIAIFAVGGHAALDR